MTRERAEHIYNYIESNLDTRVEEIARGLELSSDDIRLMCIYMTQSSREEAIETIMKQWNEKKD